MTHAQMPTHNTALTLLNLLSRLAISRLYRCLGINIRTLHIIGATLFMYIRLLELGVQTHKPGLILELQKGHI